MMRDRFYHKLQDWNREGRSMPGYRHGYGAEYIAYLLDLCDEPAEDTGHAVLMTIVDKEFPRVTEMLEGPHGWTILQMLIARKFETLTDEENTHDRTQTAS